tara:strand:+ start:1091 stop:1336 length:246 start_codon:yes stop_codon:yes gene_type:complete
MFVKSKDHLTEVKQSYWQHFYFAMSCAFWCEFSSFIMFLHAIWPGIFKEDGGDIILKQAEKINKQREKLAASRLTKNTEKL